MVDPAELKATVPVERPGGSGPADPIPLGAVTGGAAASILIVDDDIECRRPLEVWLQMAGYLTRCASSGDEAFAAISLQAPDLILLDVLMPGLDGFEVARRLKASKASASIPVIMITALTDRVARLTGLEAGAEDFVEKPVDRAELWLRVRNLLRLKTLSDLLQNQSNTLEAQVHARTASLEASELRFRQMAENIRDVFFLYDTVGNSVLYVSPAYAAIWGRDTESLYARADSWTEAIHPDDRAAAYDQYRAGLSAGRFELDCRIVRPDGSIRWIEARGFPVTATGHQGERIAGVAKDTTERKEAEHRIAYLSRIHRVLSGINGLIVRVRDRDELFLEACRIAVRDGGFRTSLIGLVDKTGEGLASVASSGLDADLLAGCNGVIASPPGHGLSLAGQALGRRRAIVSNDSRKDPRISKGLPPDGHGIGSMAALPLVVSDQAVGVLVLAAEEVDFFRAEELDVLTELANNISFAIDNIDKQKRLDYLAYYDVLTGLANRSLFSERVTLYMRDAVTAGRRLALFLIDVERFKNINDSLGQSAGDALLRQIAEWLTRNAGDASLIARVGADHFAVVLPDVKLQSDVAKLLERMIEAFAEHPFRLNDAVFRIALKAGVALFPDDGVTADSLFRNAEAALKKTKARGERYLFYVETMTEMVAGLLTMENQLRRAIDQREFVLHYQPKVNLATRQLTSAEALIRWNDPQTGLVAPGRFIPILEETGLIHEVGRWGLKEALQDHLRWRTSGLRPVRIAVNVSPRQLRNPHFVAEVRQAIGADAGAAAGLELEITETLIMEDVKHSIMVLQAIRAMGVTVAIDDFGTGFSSLAYLSRLPLDTLKIDRSFVIDMTVGPEGLSLVSTIIHLAHSLKLTVVAEGVETEEQARLLRLLGCDEIQGFLFSESLPREVFETRYLSPISSTSTPLPQREYEALNDLLKAGGMAS